MNKVVNPDQLKPLFRDGMTLMVGGFLGCGTPSPGWHFPFQCPEDNISEG